MIQCNLTAAVPPSRALLQLVAVVAVEAQVRGAVVAEVEAAAQAEAAEAEAATREGGREREREERQLEMVEAAGRRWPPGSSIQRPWWVPPSPATLPPALQHEVKPELHQHHGSVSGLLVMLVRRRSTMNQNPHILFHFQWPCNGSVGWFGVMCTSHFASMCPDSVLSHPAGGIQVLELESSHGFTWTPPHPFTNDGCHFTIVAVAHEPSPCISS